jgi:four helix bundle protein
MKDYRELIVWQRAMQLGTEIYRLTMELPKDERFVLSDQLRRACVSVPSNIAEGYGRESRNDYVRFLKMARGSLYEVETQLYLCRSIGYLSSKQTKAAFVLCTEVGKMLTATIHSLISGREYS